MPGTIGVPFSLASIHSFSQVLPLDLKLFQPSVQGGLGVHEKEHLSFIGMYILDFDGLLQMYCGCRLSGLHCQQVEILQDRVSLT